MQGQWNALQAAFSLHTLNHAHNRAAHNGSYIDPAGFALTAGMWELPEEWEQPKENA
jgi:enoyl-CoA hydratase